MNDDLISRSALKEELAKVGYDIADFGGLFFIIDKAPTVEPCYQTTSCLDCKMYDKEKHNCPRFCEVIRELVKETENEKT